MSALEFMWGSYSQLSHQKIFTQKFGLEVVEFLTRTKAGAGAGAGVGSESRSGERGGGGRASNRGGGRSSPRPMEEGYVPMIEALASVWSCNIDVSCVLYLLFAIELYYESRRLTLFLLCRYSYWILTNVPEAKHFFHTVYSNMRLRRKFKRPCLRRRRRKQRRRPGKQVKGGGPLLRHLH
jgi:hypothetical protein